MSIEFPEPYLHSLRFLMKVFNQGLTSDTPMKNTKGMVSEWACMLFALNDLDQIFGVKAINRPTNHRN